LDARYPHEWKNDLTAAFIASVYQLQKQDREAAALIEISAAQISKAGAPRFSGYYDDTARDARVLYLLARHFPSRARALEPRALQALVTPLSRGEYNTLSSALLTLAFDAYATHVAGTGLDDFAATESAGSKEVPLKLHGHLILRGTYAGDSKKLHISNDTGLTGFFTVTNAGFDRSAPRDVTHEGMEILREYLDAEGQPVKSVKMGDEITVRLRMRATELSYIPNVALTDLLPGGFEPVLRSAPAADSGASGRLAAAPPPDRFGNGGDWRPEFADVRDDRIVLYGTLTKNLAEYSYRIRATNAGTFFVPPSYAESMYDRKLRARTAAGSITVKPPGTP
jgi:uncharacterized protein YfaS (alpha-2-macroglobulin family)